MKKRFYPSRVKVKDKHYTVSLVKAASAEPSDRGTCDNKDRIILLRNSMTEKETYETFWHETLHALDYEYELKLTHPQVYALEKALAEFISANFHTIPRH
jgi:hypothetical protein